MFNTIPISVKRKIAMKIMSIQNDYFFKKLTLLANFKITLSMKLA